MIRVSEHVLYLCRKKRLLKKSSTSIKLILVGTNTRQVCKHLVRSMFTNILDLMYCLSVLFITAILILKVQLCPIRSYHSLQSLLETISDKNLPIYDTELGWRADVRTHWNTSIIAYFFWWPAYVAFSLSSSRDNIFVAITEKHWKSIENGKIYNLKHSISGTGFKF